MSTYKLTAADRRVLAQLQAKKASKPIYTRAAAAKAAADSQTLGKSEDKYKDANPLLKAFATSYDIQKNVSKGAFKSVEGLVDLVAAGVGAVGGIFSDDFQNSVQNFIAEDWASKYYDSGAYEFFIPGLKDLDKYSYTNDSKVGQTVEQVAQGVGQMLPTVAIAIATGGTSLGASAAASAGTAAASTGAKAAIGTAAKAVGKWAAKNSGMIALGASASGTGMEEAYRDGASYGQGALYGLASGATEVATEKLLPGPADAFIGKSMFGKGAKEVADQGVKRVLKETARNAVNEGFEEVASEVTNPLRKSIYKGRDAFSEYGEEDFWKGVGEAGKVGALTSVAFGATVGNVTKGMGYNGDIQASKESIKTNEQTLDKLKGDGKYSTEAEAQADANIEQNYRQIEAVLKKSTPEKRAEYIEAYELSDRFTEDGTLIAKAEDTSGFDKRYISADSRGQENRIKDALDREGVTAYHGELTEQESKNLAEVYRAHSALSEYGFADKHVVIVNEMKGTNAYIDGNIIAIGKDMLTSGEHIKKLIHETTHFTEGSAEWAQVADFVFGKDASKVKTNLAKEISAVLDGGYGVTSADVDAVVEHIASGYKTKLTEKQGLLIEEVVANRMENLFGDSESVARICREKPSLARRIWERIKALIDTFGKSESEREEIKKLRETERLFREALEVGGQDYIRGEMERTSKKEAQYSIKVKYTNGKEEIVSPYDVMDEDVINYLNMARKGQLENYAYFPVRSNTPQIIIDSLKNAGIHIEDSPMIMQALKAKNSQLEGKAKKRDGSTIRFHSLSPTEIIEAIKKIDQPISIIRETNRFKQVVIDEEEYFYPAPDRYPTFVTLDNGKECVVVLEFNSEIDDKYITSKDEKYKYHTTVTVFEPDEFFDEDGSDYAEHLLKNDDNYEIVIVKESPKSEAAHGKTLATASSKELSNNSISQNPEKSTHEVKKSKKIQYSYAGSHSETADKSKLFRAEVMYEKGIDSEEIRQRTGWFRGYDGRWRYEIDDSKLKFHNKAIDLRNRTKNISTLSKLIEHRELFASYPELREMEVIVDKTNRGPAHFNFKNSAIVFSARYLDNDGMYLMADDKTKAALLHEIQHAIQAIELTATGSSIDYWKQKIGTEIIAKNQPAIDDLNERIEVIKKEVTELGFPRLIKLAEAYRSIDHAFWGDQSHDEYRRREIARIHQEVELSGFPRGFYEYLYALEALDKKYKIINEQIEDSIEIAYNRNRLTAGEIEARDVAKRLNLTEKERKNTRPDLDQRQVYFAEKAGLDYVTMEDDSEPVTSMNEEKMQDSEDNKSRAFSESSVWGAIGEAFDHQDAGDDNLILVSKMPRYITEKFGIEGDIYIYRDHAYENMVSEEDAIAAGRKTTRGRRKIHFHNLGMHKMADALLSIEHPIMTIDDTLKEGNPQVVMILPELGNNDAPLYAALSFYSDTPINGIFEQKPHIVLTVAERDYFGTEDRPGWSDLISKAIEENRVLDYNKNEGHALTVIAQHTRLGNITKASLDNSISQFLKKINTFKQKKKIKYSRKSDTDGGAEKSTVNKPQRTEAEEKEICYANLMRTAENIIKVEKGRFFSASIYNGATLKQIPGLLRSALMNAREVTGGIRKTLQPVNAWYNSPDNAMLFKKTNDSELAADGQILFDEDIAAFLEEICEGNGALNLDELKKLDKIGSHFLNVAEKYKRVLIDGKWVDAEKYAKQMVDIMYKAYKNKTFVSTAFLNKYLRAFGEPACLFRCADGYDDNGFFTWCFEAMRKAGVNIEVDTMNTLRSYREWHQAHKKWGEHLSKDTVSFRGQKIPIEIAMTLYCSLKTRKSQQGLADSGYEWREGKKNDVKKDKGLIEKPDPINKKSKKNRRRAVDAACKAAENELWNMFSETDRQYIQMFEKILNEECRKWKIETDKQMKGFSLVSDDGEYYFPTVHAQIKKTVSTSNYEGDRVAHLSSNKNVVEGARGSLLLEPIDVVVMRHIRNQLLYKHYAIVAENISMLMNINVGNNVHNPNTLKTMIEEGGDHYRELLRMMDKLSKDLQGMPSGEKAEQWFIYEMVEFLRTGYAKYQLGANPKTLFSQLSSLIAACNILDFTSIARGMKGFVSSETAHEVDKYCPIAELRNTDNVAAKAQGVIDKAGKVGDFLMKGIGFVDRRVVCALFNSCQIQVEKDSGLKLGTEENKVEAGKLLTKVILETQQNTFVTERSDAMRGGVFARSFTMFSADSMKTMARWLDSIGKVSVLKRQIKNSTDESEIKALESELKKANGQLAKSSAVIVSQAIFMALLAWGFRWLYNKDDEPEEETKNIGADFLGNMLGGLPLLRDVYSYFSDGYELDNFMLSTINDVLIASKKSMDLTVSAMKGESITKQEVASSIKNSLYATGQLLGIPVRNVYNISSGITRRFFPSAGYNIDNLFYKQSYNADLQKAIEKGDEDMIDTITGLILDENIGGVTDKALRSQINKLAGDGYSVLPRSVGDTVTYDGDQIKLTKKQQKRFKELYAVGHESAAELVKLQLYRNADDEAKARAINFIYNTYYNLALQEALGVDLEGKNVLFAEALDIEQLAIIYAIASGIEADKDRKGNTIAGSRKAKIEKYVQSLPITAAEKYLIMGYLGYKCKNGEAQVKAYVNRLRLSKDERARLMEYCGYAA